MPDRCPGVLMLHQAADGRLARIRVPGGRLSAEQLRALADATGLGNGLLDLTARANVQVRGLDELAAGSVAARLNRCGLLPSVAHDRARNVIASATAGRHPRSLAATDAVVAAIDDRLCADPVLADVPGRFLFVVDDGSGLALERLGDVTLVARDRDTYALALGGWATAKPVSADRAAAVAVAAAAAFLAERARGSERASRIAELTDGPRALAQRLGTTVEGPFEHPFVPALMPGCLEQRDGRLAITALVPLGRLDRERLAELAAVLGDHELELRLSTSRTLTLVDVEPPTAVPVQRRLREIGLVLERDSGWIGLTACAGLGRCSRARLDVRTAAAARAAVRGYGAPAEHWAACDRRCGERSGQQIAVTAMPDGVAVRTSSGEQVVGGVAEAMAALA
jgi:sulfite reductase beta subunit-like hemoprotein